MNRGFGVGYGVTLNEVSQSPFKHFLGEDLPQFAHPAEAEFARLLDAKGLPWDYEPHTFVLAYAEDGRIVEAFTPDSCCRLRISTSRPHFERLRASYLPA